MRSFTPPLLIFILWAFCFSSAQAPTTVRVGVTVLRSDDKAISATDMRDRLVKALNRQKLDKKRRLSVEAVALESALGGDAIAEAKAKNCQFVLSTLLTDLRTSAQTDLSDLAELTVFDATVAYRLVRASDGVLIAMGAAKAEQTTTLPAVAREAMAQVADKVIAEIAKAGSVPPPDESAMARKPLEELRPGPAGVPMVSANLCAWLPTDIPHGEVLPGVCQYVMTLPQKMPNFICHQEASRYRGKSPAPSDLIAASVRYEDGNETYSEIKVNGKPAPIAEAQATGLWTSGEFGSNNLRSIFGPVNQPLFRFARESAVGEHAAWVFTYQVAKQNEALWRLRGEDQVAAPPYAGELWVDQKTGAVLRFRSMAKDLPENFPLTGAEQRIEYENVAFADGSAFVLPIEFAVTTTYRGEEETRNLVRFTDCHKFRARGRLVLDAQLSPAGGDAAGQVPPSAASLQRDRNEREAVFAAIGEQALQESEARREADQEQMLNAVTALTVERMVTLQRERRQIQAQNEAIARNTANTIETPDTAPRITFRASARLVLVSVVLRDAKGQAIGHVGQEAFRLFDEGKLQVIQHFSVEGAESSVLGQQAAGPVRAPETAQPALNQMRTAGQERDTAYLFDDVHLSLEEIRSARQAAERHLGSLKAGERAAIFTTSEAVAVDFTDDREKLLAGLRALKPHAIIPEHDCPAMSYYMADRMLNKQDAAASAAAIADVIACAFHGFGTPGQAQRLAASKAFEVLNAGGMESRNALAVFENVIRRTAAMPGQRSIVLVSPGFLAITQDTQEAEMEIVNRAVESGIVINTLDAGGVSTVGFSGETAYSGGDHLQVDSADLQARGDVMSEFASGTGGVFFHNNNNLDEGFRRTGGVPEFVYVLGFSPQKLDGKLHKLKVTLNGTGKFDVQARREYFAFKPAEGK
jgi:VWFA-related protein